MGTSGTPAQIAAQTGAPSVIAPTGTSRARSLKNRRPPDASRKSLSPKPLGPPKTPPELQSLKLSISFRSDQKPTLERLTASHRLSLLCQQAVDLDAELEDLPDGVRDDALEAAAYHFAVSGLTGSYAISQNELIRHEATADEIRLDSDALGILVGNLMLALQDLWDLEKEYALRKAVVLRKCGGGNESI